MCCLGSLSLSLEKGPAWKEQTEGSISFMLAKRDAPPELLPGTAGLEMEQISVLILVMLGSAHSQLLVRVSVSPLGVEQAWQSNAATALSPSPAEPFLPGLWPPQLQQSGEHTGAFPLWVLAPCAGCCCRAASRPTYSNFSFSPSFVH